MINVVLVFVGFRFSSRHVFDSPLEAAMFARGFQVASGVLQHGLDARVYALPRDQAQMVSTESAREIERAYDAVKGTPT